MFIELTKDYDNTKVFIHLGSILEVGTFISRRDSREVTTVTLSRSCITKPYQEDVSVVLDTTKMSVKEDYTAVKFLLQTGRVNGED